jgi:CheY-like chemotaxis protein
VWAPPEVLILEDDLQELAALEAAIRDAHLEPVPTSAPPQALRQLDRHRPILAIVDLDMSRAQVDDRRIGVYDVLRQLHARHENCVPLVYSAGVETIDDQARVYVNHPHALFQSKRHGPKRLLERIDGLLSGRVGDLALRGGVVVHLPTGTATNHRVAISLVTAKRANRSVLLRDSDARAARRFQDWLDEIGSPVVVRALGNRQYQLAVRTPAESSP